MSPIKMPELLKPYRSTLYFLLVLVCAHFFWKLLMKGDDTDTVVTFLGLDLSAPFNAMAAHVARVVYKVLEYTGFNVTLRPFNVICHDNMVCARIVWSCTGFKQAFIFLMIILFYKGSYKPKLWFIPLSMFAVYLINIVRISAIIALIKSYPAYFTFLHEYLFKYLFYIVLFAIWIYWDEKINTSLSERD